MLIIVIVLHKVWFIPLSRAIKFMTFLIFVITIFDSVIFWNYIGIVFLFLKLLIIIQIFSVLLVLKCLTWKPTHSVSEMISIQVDDDGGVSETNKKIDSAMLDRFFPNQRQSTFLWIVLTIYRSCYTFRLYLATESRVDRERLPLLQVHVKWSGFDSRHRQISHRIFLTNIADWLRSKVDSSFIIWVVAVTLVAVKGTLFEENIFPSFSKFLENFPKFLIFSVCSRK